jgi:hypothetical protein
MFFVFCLRLKMLMLLTRHEQDTQFQSSLTMPSAIQKTAEINSAARRAAARDGLQRIMDHRAWNGCCNSTPECTR